MLGLGEGTTKRRNEACEPWKAVAEDKANVAVISGLRKKFSAAKEAAVELLLTLEKSPDLQVDAERKVRSAGMES